MIEAVQSQKFPVKCSAIAPLMARDSLYGPSDPNVRLECGWNSITDFEGLTDGKEASLYRLVIELLCAITSIGTICPSV